MNVVDSFSFFEQLESNYRELLGCERDRKEANKNKGGEKLSDEDKKAKQSFLYHYLKMKKDDRARKIFEDKKLLLSVRDKYVRFRGANLALENNIITKEEFRGVFFELNGGAKAREELFDRAPETALDQLEDRLLKECVDDFIQNAKVKLKKYKNDPTKDLRIDIIEMLNEFGKYSLGETVASSSDFSEDYIEKCEALYKIIRADKKMAGCFIPLYVDKDSGAGIYIVGKDIINTDDVKEAKVCMLVFDAVDEADEPYLPIETTYTICGGVREAFKELKKGVEIGYYFNKYSEYNGVKLPKNADECFGSRFFSTQSTADKRRGEIIRKYCEQEAEGTKKMKEDE